MLNILAFTTRYWKPLAGALAMLVITGAVLMYGSHKYNQGVTDERAKQVVAAVAAAKSRGQVDEAIDRLPDGAALSELRRDWSRD